MLTIFLAFIVSVYFSYLILWPFNPLLPYKDHGAILKKEYCVGEPVLYKVHLKKCTDSTVEVHPAFIDGIIYQMPSFSGDYKRGELNFWNQSIIIPETLPEGTYYLTITAIVKLNNFRNIVYITMSEKFKVVECKK